MFLDQTSEIKSRLDIVEVVSEYVTLKKAGANYKGLCPFHQEKSPSFMVSADKQIAYCFGCRGGGDVIAFVQQVEGLSFPETLKLLGERVGIQVKASNPKTLDERSRLSLMQEDVCKMYAEVLLSKNGEKARTYLYDRGLDDKTIAYFSLGYAPEGWEVTRDFLRKQGFKDPEIMAGGLGVVSSKGRGNYDRFRDRLMFPIFNAMGGVVAFGGRAMDKKAQAKYINSPETMIYDKSSVLYGLHKAKASIKEQDLVIVVEGYMDVIACHQFDSTNVVASCGTALTSRQIKLIKRYTSHVAFAFDQDGAGQAAMLRGIDTALHEGLSVSIVLVPDGKDPDECIRKDPAKWHEAVRKRVPYMNWVFAKGFHEYDISSASGKAKCAEFILPHLKKIRNLIEQTHYLQKLAMHLSVSEDTLRSELKKIKGAFKKKPVPAPKKHSSRYKKEHYLFAILLRHPSWIIELEELGAFSLLSEGFRDQIEDLRQFSNDIVEYSQEAYIAHLSEKVKRSIELLALYMDEAYQEMTLKELKEEFHFLIRSIRKENSKKALDEVVQDLKRAEALNDREQVMKLKEKLSELMKQTSAAR